MKCQLAHMSCSFGPSHGPNHSGYPGRLVTGAALLANFQLNESLLFHLQHEIVK